MNIKLWWRRAGGRQDGRTGGPTHAAGLLGGPLVVFLAGDVLLAHQLESGQALEVESVAVTEARPLPLAVGGDAGISAAALLDLCGGKKKKKVKINNRLINVAPNNFLSKTDYGKQTVCQLK